MATFLILQHDDSDDPMALQVMGKADAAADAPDDAIKALGAQRSLGGTVVAVRWDTRTVRKMVPNPGVAPLSKDELKKCGL